MKREELYRGKAKIVWATDDPAEVVMEFTDRASAFDGAKKGTIATKGESNATISALVFDYLTQQGIPTHFVRQLSPTELLCRRLQIVPLEVVVRNRVAGSLARRLGLEEGAALRCPVLELNYKNDALGDPMVNETHALAVGMATAEELEEIREMARAVNALLRGFFAGRNLELIDFKLEFGRESTPGGDRILLGDEISPDTCRLWDMATGERLDKDRFRRDLGGVEAAYQEVVRRVQSPAAPAVVDGGGKYRSVVRVHLKKGVLDPQGQTIANALRSLGYRGVDGVRVGKLMELLLSADAGEDEAAVRRQVWEMAQRLLANPVLEDFTFTVEPEARA